MLSQVFKIGSSWLALFFAELLSRVRGSLLVGGTLIMLSSTGTWMYLGNSLAAHDMKRSAALAPVEAAPDVVVVAIDDVAYSQFFGGRSPLNKSRLIEFLSAVTTAVPATTQLVVDLDMSPAPGENTAALLAFWTKHTPQRWVIADPVLAPQDSNPATAVWRAEVCDTGVRLGAPYLPFEFGYVSGTHQFRGGFADVVVNGMPDCANWMSRRDGWQVDDGRLVLPRQAFPLSAAFIKDGLVLPFQGDLQALHSTLAQLKPKVVVIGGMWGTGDVFLTPFGERFGVHLHAAAIAGAQDKLHLAPYWMQLLVGLVCVSMLSMVLGWLQRTMLDRVGAWGDRRLQVRVSPAGDSLPGHVFLMHRVWPFGATCMVFAALLGISEGLAHLQVRTGLWLPSSGVVYVVIVTLLFTWNWGLNRIRTYKSVGHVWQSSYVNPIREDLKSIMRGWQRLLNQPSMKTTSISRRRAVIEAILCSVSLIAQTVLPLTALYLAITKPL